MWYASPKVWIAAFVIAGSFGAGWTTNGWRWSADYANLERDYAKEESKAIQKTLDATLAQNMAELERTWRLEETDRANSATKAALDAETRTITERVIRYVQSDNAGSCGLDADGVRIVNGAAGLPGAETDSEAAGGTDATAGAVVASVSGNYSLCRRTSQRLNALQSWVDSLHE